jgi:alpha-1,3-rhamnosyl/mannosyltransferase
VRELLSALAARDEPYAYRLYARTPWEAPLDDRFSWELIRARDPIWHACTAAAANRDCDVFLSTNSYLTVTMLKVPAVVIVHDLLAFDRAMGPNRYSAVIERLTLGPAIRRARTLWCVSHTTADALLERYPGASRKVAVVPWAASPALARPGVDELPELPEQGFVLAVGTLEPRKNLPRLIEAYASLPSGLQTANPLVIVGARGWSTGPTVAAIRSLGDRCVALGHVSDAVLAELYRRCTVFCYPSLGEGFGLPVLEAMAAGAAVVTSNLSSLPEVGGAGAEYVDPHSVQSIAAGLEGILSSAERRVELGDRARVRAATFSWDATAAASIGLLERAAGDDRDV